MTTERSDVPAAAPERRTALPSAPPEQRTTEIDKQRVPKIGRAHV